MDDCRPMFLFAPSVLLYPSFLATFFREASIHQREYFSDFGLFAFFFAYNVLVSLKMNYSYDDSRALNLWQRVHFNTDSSNDASSTADAWRRLLVQLQTFRRRLATTFNYTKLKSLESEKVNRTPSFFPLMISSFDCSPDNCVTKSDGKLSNI